VRIHQNVTDAGGGGVAGTLWGMWRYLDMRRLCEPVVTELATAAA
jgi:hypothetical protein